MEVLIPAAVQHRGHEEAALDSTTQRVAFKQLLGEIIYPVWLQINDLYL